MNQKPNETPNMNRASRPGTRRSIRFFPAFFRPVTIVAAVAILAAACGNETDAGSASSDDFESPLADYLGFDGFDMDPETIQTQINDSIVACMQAEGFEYIPSTQNVVSFEEEAGPDGLVYGSDEWVEKYGLGISTQAFPQETVGPDLVGYDDSFFGPGDSDEAYEDPNAEYVESLSESEQEAYYEALWGDGDDFGPAVTEGMTEEEEMAAIEEWEANYEPTGCEPLAWEEAWGGDEVEAFFEEFEDEFGAELEEAFGSEDSHPRIVEAEQAISSCISDKGLDYGTMEDLYDEFDSRLQPIYTELEGAFEFADEQMAEAMTEEAMTEEEFNALSDEQQDEFFAHPELSDESKALLAEIQADEIELAVALNECGANDLDELYTEVRIEIEEQFIEDNRDRIDDFKAAQAGS